MRKESTIMGLCTFLLRGLLYLAGFASIASACARLEHADRVERGGGRSVAVLLGIFGILLVLGAAITH